MTQDVDFDVFFTLLKDALKQYSEPIVSRSKKNIADTPYTTLISCVLSLRTKDEVTEVAAVRLLKKYDTPKKMLSLSEPDIASLIYPVGFYRTKAKRILEISHMLLTEYSGRVPRDFNELMNLPGVGRKTANIVMVYGHHLHGFIPVDTHCHRIPNRLGWVNTDTPEESEMALKKVLPERFWDDFNDLFVTFGQKICVPISPFCSRCPVEDFCARVGVTRSR